jgi:hypothetical protein
MAVRALYKAFMHDWETRLATADTNRVVRPFEVGLEWMTQWPRVNGHLTAGHGEPCDYLGRVSEHLVAASDEFFAYPTPADFRLERRPALRFATGNSQRNGSHGHGTPPLAEFLRFTSPVKTPYPENNLANARWFPARGRRAVVVLPQWNADAESHNMLCRGFNLLAIAALRLSMPYHDVRRPPELERADYAVSSNLGRTIDATRQGILEIRCCLDWLEQQGYTELGVVGTSLGSCYAFIAAAHDPRLKVTVHNHASAYFADVVWHGQSTRHIRQGLESGIDLERLRRCWLCISPMAYFDRFERWPRKSLIIYATCDLTFLPEFSLQIIGEFARRRLDHRVVALPCGHYSIGEAPFKYLDGYHIASYLRTAL